MNEGHNTSEWPVLGWGLYHNKKFELVSLSLIYLVLLSPTFEILDKQIWTYLFTDSKINKFPIFFHMGLFLIIVTILEKG